jgi:hypothetical protein
MVAHNFRVKMLPSWAERLERVELPSNWTRVTKVATGPSACVVVIEVRDEQPREERPFHVNVTLRALLDCEGYLMVEAISQQTADAIRG